VLADFDDRPEIAAFQGVGAILRYSARSQTAG
jgi:hypothetical protein